MRLNDSVFGGLRTKESAYYVFRDDGTRGTGRLGIKIFPSGRKSFVYRFQVGGKRQFKTRETGLTSRSNRQRNVMLNWQVWRTRHVLMRWVKKCAPEHCASCLEHFRRLNRSLAIAVQSVNTAHTWNS